MVKIRHRHIAVIFFIVFTALLGAQSADQLYASGRGAFSDGLWPAASSQFARLLREYPEYPRADSAAYMGAVAYYNAKDYRRCIDVFQSFSRRYPDSAWNRRAAYWEGLAFFALEDWSEAIPAFQRQSLITDEPEYSERSLFYLGVCKENVGDWEDAEAVYKSILDSGRDRDLISRAIFRSGQIKLSDGRYPEALKLFTQLAWDYSALPVSVDIDYWIAESHRRMGHNAKALEGFRSFLASVYDSPYRTYALLEAARLAAHEQLDDEALAYLDLRDEEENYHADESDAAVIRIRAASYLRAGQIAKARDAYATILNNSEDPVEKQVAEFDLAQTWIGTDEVLSALPHLRRASFGPDARIAADALFLAGNILLHSGEASGADHLEAFARRFATDKRREKALRLAARFRRDEGDYQQAIAGLSILISDYPQSADAPSYLFSRAEIFLDSGDSTSALRDYGFIAKTYEKSRLLPEAHSRIGFIYAERDEHIRAATHFIKAAQIADGMDMDEAERRAIYSAGVAFFNGGNKDEAIAQFSQLVTSDITGPWGVDAAYYLGEAYYEKNDNDRAREAYEMAVRYGDSAMVFKALYGIAWTWFRDSQWSKAADVFLKAAEASENREHKAKSRYRAGLSRSSAGEWNIALKLYDQALAAKVGDWREEALYHRAWALLNSNRIDEAWRTADTLAIEFPGSKLPADLPFRMGENAMTAGSYREASVWYDLCISKFPNSEIAIRAGLRAALAARESGNPDEASERYIQWIIVHPTHPSAQAAARSLGESLKESANPQKAYSAWKRMRAAAPNAHELLAPLAVAWARVANIPSESLKTLETIAEAKTLPPADRAEALLLIAHRYRMDERYARSRELYEVLVRDIPGQIGAEAQEGLARSYAQEGKINQAAEAYLALPYLFPDQTDLGNRSLREAEKLYRQAGRNSEADKIRARLKP